MYNSSKIHTPYLNKCLGVILLKFSQIEKENNALNCPPLKQLRTVALDGLNWWFKVQNSATIFIPSLLSKTGYVLLSVHKKIYKKIGLLSIETVGGRYCKS
jgi:hypothetical protein